MRRLFPLLLALALVLTPPVRAATVYGYSEGLAQYEEEGLWGFVDAAGVPVIPARYNSVVSFSLGLAAVNLHGKLGVIRPDGTYLLPPQYDTLMPVGYGLYMAQQGSDWGVVSILPQTDSKGHLTHEVYPISYASVEVDQRGGVNALILQARGGGQTVMPLFRLPSLLSELGVENGSFPLTRGRLPDFTDVEEKSWYALWVDLAYNTGIMAGIGGGEFEPEREITVAEALQMAANMTSRYRGDTFHSSSSASVPWYNEAVAYCQATGILSPGQFDSYERIITRRELAQVFAATTLAQSLPLRNSLSLIREAVTDVSPDDPAAGAVWSLYARGILTGVDRNLSFRPDTNVTRAEAAALATRLARPEQRIDLFTPPVVLQEEFPEEI